MKLALECPQALLEMVQPFADFDWVLAKKVLDDEVYTKFYRDSDKVKFVDNSVNEEGEPVSLEDLLKAFEDVGGTYIVSPDWIGDGKKTLEAYKECIGKIPIEKVIPVVQGSTFEEALLNIITYINLGAKSIAVPYDICSTKKDPPKIMGLRRALVVSKIPDSIYIHLLGFNSIDEFIWYQNKPSVGSIDTGVPIMLGLKEGDILDDLESKEKPTLNQMGKAELSQQGWTAICRNIALLRKYIG